LDIDTFAVRRAGFIDPALKLLNGNGAGSP
jgi:hypothetical protein